MGRLDIRKAHRLVGFMGLVLRLSQLVLRVQWLKPSDPDLWGLKVLTRQFFVNHASCTSHGITAKVVKFNGKEQIALQLLQYCLLRAQQGILTAMFWLSWQHSRTWKGHLALRFSQTNGALIGPRVKKLYKEQHDAHHCMVQKMVFTTSVFSCFNLEDKVGVEGKAMLWMDHRPKWTDDLVMG